MRLKLNTKILLGFLIALTVLLLTSLMAYRSIGQLAFYTRQVEHTYKVLQHTSELRTRVRDAHTAVRGYLLLADTARLREYRISLRNSYSSFDSLLALTRDNPVQQTRLDTLRQLVAQEKLMLDKWATVTPTPYAARDLVLADQLTILRLRQLLTEITATETALLRQHSENRDFYENTTPLTIIVSAVLAILMMLWLFAKISQELRANQRLQSELRRVNQDVTQRIAIIEQLAERVAQGDYSVKISSGKQQDSLGNLATSLNLMTQTLEDTFTALHNRNNELDQFAYVTSHDLKAPLRGVMTVVRWIEEELAHELSSQMQQYLGMIKGRLGRLEDLINGLLIYARVGRTEQELEEVNVAELVREVVELVVPAQFKVAVANPLPTLLTNRLRLEQVLTNLLSNAVKYHHTGAGTITIGCQDIGKCYEFRVQDDGPGIAPEYHEKIFLIFQTLRDRHTAESTGIGLSIVKKIVDEQKGSIHVESVAGQGAAFVFTWPK
jgi:signal transduction histidine kinase